MKDFYASSHKRFIETGELPENLKDRVLDKTGRWVYIRYHSLILNNPFDPQAILLSLQKMSPKKTG